MILTTYLYAYATSETNNNDSKTLDQLKPYTDYSCVGTIETEDNSTLRTKEINFRIDCSTLTFTLFL